MFSSFVDGIILEKKPRSEGDLLPDRNMEIWITCGLIKWAVKSANPYE